VWSLSDESLLAGLASGDREAAAAFVRRFQARVFGLALAILRDREAAEDVAQEAFLRAWRHAASYDARRGQVAAWVLGITRNLAIDALRMRRSDAIDPNAVAALEAALAPGAGPDEAALAADQAGRLRRALAALPTDQRRALVLAAFCGRTAREIAELEQTPLGTAKTRIRAAMIKVRDELRVADER
jgi:RNA polymerase sigma-70 factor (ECF subfamily)